MRNLTLLILFCSSFEMQAQLPGYEIYYMYIGSNEDSGYVYSEPLNITNLAGYDNQPSFSKDGSKILYASIRDEKQSDIYVYDCNTNTTKQFTNTIESEYSPEVSPDGKYITAVRVEQDSSQRLWQFKQKNKKPKVLLQYIYDVGYYCRINADKIALFQLPEPFTLKLASAINQNANIIDKNIGRCIKMIPGENAFCYITKDDTLAWTIRKFDLSTNDISLLTNIDVTAEDFAWYRDGNLFMAEGSTIYYYDYNEDNTWFRFDDFSKFGIEKIYRIAFSLDGNWMAFVAEETIRK
ncbi:MAG: PD40 domain-containing protein [Fimbriimonadaceae bacterium]|nr:PD40 domain-containing protein [Chitinophagales bacterium]